MFSLPPSRTLLRPTSLPRQLRPWARGASRRPSPWPEIQGPPGDQPKLRTWVAPASRIANFLIVPTAILYAVFFADFGDHEHVFSPPRRWLESQKSAFFSLSPEEQKLVGVDAAKSESPAGVQGSGPSRWYALRPTFRSS
ncbi:hypothetical protein GSI_15216 [Ganoderma sinense ZZ0214-1]|uniref:Uncharacterized protein n=1 Tax=Ganoderma sinense ZZ0214-1 TaxID=1077348 RepID=A0A2G8RLY6_9APHY|nr:hypothetical protein GSI_15216 [Ganoderma sinense ZZ0214-1]